MNIIIDGNNMAWRCKHKIHLSYKGKDVSVTYGVLKSISHLIDKFKPSSITVCWDGGTPDFRRQAVIEYKANREHGDIAEYNDFLRQLQELSDYTFPMMGIVTVRKVGAEADDLMYHASRVYNGYNTIITTDTDLLQAINIFTTVYNPIKDINYDQAKFEAEYGISLYKFADFRALIGDGSDNIPGVHGIGAKTALKLFQEFGDISGIVNAALGINPKGSISSKLAEAIKEFGFARMVKNVQVMVLYADRVGSKREIIAAVERYTTPDVKRIKKYLMSNAFTSLMGELPFKLAKLEQPTLVELDDVKQPVVCARRMAVI